MSAHTYQGRRRLRVQLDRMVNVGGDQHYRQRQVYATREGTVELWIDTEQLLTMLAAHALQSKGGKAQLGSGAIVVKRKEFTDTPAEGAP